jgi:hypothetical protein
MMTGWQLVCSHQAYIETQNNKQHVPTSGSTESKSSKVKLKGSPWATAEKVKRPLGSVFSTTSFASGKETVK